MDTYGEDNYNFNPQVQQALENQNQDQNIFLNSLQLTNWDQGLFISLLQNLQTSQQDLQNVSNILKSNIMVPFIPFLNILQRMIQMQQNQDGENEKYSYMKQNLIKILIGSLRIYQKKEVYLFDPQIDDFIKNGDKIQNSHQGLMKLFSNPGLCEKLLNYVRNEFNDNIPDGNFDPSFFKQCWEDYSHFKQRQIDKKPSDRKDLTLFNKIYKFDVFYQEIIEQIIIFNQTSKLKQFDKHQIQQSSVIIKYGLEDFKDLIQQNQQRDVLILNQIQNHKQKLKELQEQLKDITKTQKKEKIVLEQNSKVKITFELMRKKQKLHDILGRIMLKDLQKQLGQGIILTQVLNDLYQFLQLGYVQIDFQCTKENILQLYQNQDGMKYLLKFIEQKITNYIYGDNNDIKQIENDLYHFKKSVGLIQPNKKKKK